MSGIQGGAFQSGAFQLDAEITSFGGFATWGPDTGRVRAPWNMLDPYVTISDDEALILLA